MQNRVFPPTAKTIGSHRVTPTDMVSIVNASHCSNIVCIHSGQLLAKSTNIIIIVLNCIEYMHGVPIPFWGQHVGRYMIVYC